MSSEPLSIAEHALKDPEKAYARWRKKQGNVPSAFTPGPYINQDPDELVAALQEEPVSERPNSEAARCKLRCLHSFSKDIFVRRRTKSNSSGLSDMQRL